MKRKVRKAGKSVIDDDHKSVKVGKLVITLTVFVLESPGVLLNRKEKSGKDLTSKPSDDL